MQGMSERDYAAPAGLSRGAIQKAKRTRWPALFADGSIDAAASDARRAETTDPDQQRRSIGETTLSGAAEPEPRESCAHRHSEPPRLQPGQPYHPPKQLGSMIRTTVSGD